MLAFGPINTAEKAAHCAALCLAIHRQVQGEFQKKGQPLPLNSHWLDMTHHFTQMAEKIIAGHATQDEQGSRTATLEFLLAQAHTLLSCPDIPSDASERLCLDIEAAYPGVLTPTPEQ